MAAVNESEYNELAKKVVKYKTAFRKSKTQIELLSAKKAEMSELATEYLTVVKTMKRDLDAQTQLNAELKQQLAKANPNNAMPDARALKDLVQQRARAHVLKLKNEFEARLKEKNELIRKLKDRQTIEF